MTVLRALFAAAIAAADPHAVLARHLPAPPRGRCVVVGAGKAAASMAAAVEAAWPEVALSGLVVTRYGHAEAIRRIEVVQAGHPVPDAAGERAARAILQRVRGLQPDDLVLALISGGGSSLLALPAEGLTLADKQAVNRALLAGGVPIGEMNAVRGALSAIKAGRLALAARPARLATLLISDVPGDDPALIASGPTVPAPPTRRRDALAILLRYGITPPDAVLRFLAAPDPPHVAQPEGDVRLIASPAMALAAAAEAARGFGLTPMILGAAIEGESRELGRVLAGIAHSVKTTGHPLAAPAVLLSGGETTVTMPATSNPRGGRNTECLLALAVALQGLPGVWALAGDTDGIDGNQDAAGAIVTPTTLPRAHALGLDPRALLAAHESYRMFDALGDLVQTGPTRTNVNDFRAVLIR